MGSVKLDGEATPAIVSFRKDRQSRRKARLVGKIPENLEEKLEFNRPL